jgi:hypothetical protein
MPYGISDAEEAAALEKFGKTIQGLQAVNIMALARAIVSGSTTPSAIVKDLGLTLNAAGNDMIDRGDAVRDLEYKKYGHSWSAPLGYYLAIVQNNSKAGTAGWTPSDWNGILTKPYGNPSS